MSTIKRPTSRASKDDILAAFDKLNAEYKKLAASGAETPAAAPSKEQTVATSHVASAGSAGSSEASIEGTIAGLLSLREGFGNAVNALSTKLTAEAARLTGLRREVDEEVKQLSTLHEIKVSDQTLQTLIAEYHTKAEAFKRELADKQETFESELETKTGAWTTEKEEHARAVAERDEVYKKSQKRTAEEYDYELAQKRKAEADAYDQARKAKDKELEEFVQAKNKTWAEREKLVADQEALLTDSKAKFDELPARLEAAVKKARGEGAGIASGQSKTKADLLAKEIDGERRVFELKVRAMEATIKERAHQIETLSAQLSAALKQGQDLAVKAIEGASNSTSFMAVKEIALEQAKNTPKSK